MEVVFIAKLHGLKLLWSTEKGVHLTSALRISNDRKTASRILQPTKPIIGALEASQFEEEAAFAYARHNYPEDSVHPLTVVNNYLIMLQGLFTAMWLIKDNSVTTQIGFAYATTEKGILVSSNVRSAMYTDALGESREVQLSPEEFRDLRGLVDVSFGRPDRNIPLENWDPTMQRPGEIPPDRESNRVERVWYELQRTRSISYVPAKIASYCTILEALLSTDSSEVSHKISERAARLTEITLPERLRVYYLVKQAYAIRSRNVHGGLPPRNLDDAKRVSVELDDLIRKLLNGVFRLKETKNRFLAPDTVLDKWFLELTLS